MLKALASVFVVTLSLCLVGCGSNSDEIAPLTEGTADPPPEVQRSRMEESASHGGYQVPEQGNN